MIDENTPLADDRSFVSYDATSKQAAEGGDQDPSPIDRVFVAIALLGTQAQNSLKRKVPVDAL